MDAHTYIDVAPHVIEQLFYVGGLMSLAERDGTFEGETAAFRQTIADYESVTPEYFALAASHNRGTLSAEAAERYQTLLMVRNNRLQTALSLAHPVVQAYGSRLVAPYVGVRPTVH